MKSLQMKLAAFRKMVNANSIPVRLSTTHSTIEVLDIFHKLSKDPKTKKRFLIIRNYCTLVFPPSEKSRISKWVSLSLIAERRVVDRDPYYIEKGTPSITTLKNSCGKFITFSEWFSGKRPPEDSKTYQILEAIHSISPDEFFRGNVISFKAPFTGFTAQGSRHRTGFHKEYRNGMLVDEWNYGVHDYFEIVGLLVDAF